MAGAETMQVRVVAQDPSVELDNRILTDVVSFPYEGLQAGPMGHRVHVVDYDSTSQTFYRPAEMPADPTKVVGDRTILRDPEFHARNVYALVMSTLARFEFALGRRVEWGFGAHQLKVVPHAFAIANAFYSHENESLLFGYFERERNGETETVYTCLSHDIVVHETTHALLDGVRSGFLHPSSPDQAAFHEGFADIVALLSIFRMPKVASRLIGHAAELDDSEAPDGFVPKSALSARQLKRSAFFALAEQFADDTSRLGALRRSVDEEPDRNILRTTEFLEPHRRGEVLVAATMRAFLAVWRGRLTALSPPGSELVDCHRAAEEGAAVADQMLTMFIRALDYTPPVHLTFRDFLSAVLTADSELRTDDTKYRLRDHLLEHFASYGITPAPEAVARTGCWPREDKHLGRSGVRFSSLQSDPTEMFRLIWANRDLLGFRSTAYSWVSEVKPCTRVEPEDGFVVRETVAQWMQKVKVDADELRAFGLRKPRGMDDDTEIALDGGSTLILDEYGTLKYRISNPLPDPLDPASVAEAQERLDYLFESGAFARGATFQARLSNLHRKRSRQSATTRREVW
jgi:hypothetical protein